MVPGPSRAAHVRSKRREPRSQALGVEPVPENRQTVTWDGATLSNVSAFKKPPGGIAALNGATWGSVPIVVT